MSENWKPGDYVAVQLPGSTLHGECGVVVQDSSLSVVLPRISRKALAFASRDLRRLVVIDPEDREQVERLDADLARRMAWLGDVPHRVTEMQAALREFANPTPPKPDEPQGLGAVVEEADGHQFVRRVPAGGWTEDAWVRAAGAGLYRWADIAAVRVLSEGVVPQ